MDRTDISQSISIHVSTWGRLAATSVAHMTEHLYVGVTTIVLPAIASALGLSMSQVGLLVSARYLVAGLSNIPSGLLADLIDRRSLLLGLSLVALGLSSFLMSLASDFWMLLVLMAIGGIGAGGFHPQSLAILSSAYRERRALSLGVHDSAGNLGEVLAPLTLGILLSQTDWRGTLQIWALPGLVVGVLYALFSSEANGLTISRARLQRSLWEDIITNRAVFGMFLISVFRSMGQAALMTFLPLYMTLQLGLSVGTVGAYISTVFLFAGIAPTCSGWIADRIGRGRIIVFGTALSALAVMALPYLSPGIPLAVGCALVGTLLWALRPIIFAASMEVTPPELAGSLVGFIFTGNMGLSFIAPILTGIVADRYGLGTAVAFVGAFPFLACLAALSPLVRARH
jgi:MFS family permease